jgi:hypothetical protein
VTGHRSATAPAAALLGALCRSSQRRPRPRSARPLQPHRALLAGGIVAMLLAVPAAVVAATGPETAPPPSTPTCALALSTAVAGTPFEVTGTTASGAAVTASAWRTDKTVREAAVATLNGTWRASFLFGAADGGEWTVAISGEGVDCASPLTVTLPPGMVAPPTQPAAVDVVPDASAGGVDAPSLQSVLVNGAVILVVGSWIFLPLVRFVHASGRRPLTRRGVRRVAMGAAFVAVLGACLAVWVVVDFGAALSHFDTTIPPDEQAVLNAAGWGTVAIGSVLGTLAALRVRRASPSPTSP